MSANSEEGIILFIRFFSPLYFLSTEPSLEQILLTFIGLTLGNFEKTSGKRIFCIYRISLLASVNPTDIFILIYYGWNPIFIIIFSM